MQKFLILILTPLILSLNLIKAHAQDSCEIQKWEWAQKITSTRNLKTSSSGIDPLGNFYFAGSYEGETNFQDSIINDESTSGYVSKYNSKGDLIWFYSLKGGENEIVNITIHEDHLFLAVNFRNDLFFPDDTLTSSVQGIGVVKLDLKGNLIWAKKIGDLFQGSLSAINVDRSGNMFIAGIYLDQADFDGESFENEGNYRGFLLSLNSLGAKLWVTRLSESGESFINDLDFDANDNIYAVGEYSGVIEYNNGNSYLTANDVYLQSILVGFNSSGQKFDVIELIQQDYFGYSIAHSLSIDNENNFVIGTSTLGQNLVIGEKTYEFEGSFLIKLDASKNVTWSAQLETGMTILEDVLIDNEDNIYVGVGGFNHLLQKYTSSGTEIFNIRITGFNYDLGDFSFTLNDGKIMISGDMPDPTPFGDTTLIPEASKNLYLALLNVNASLPAPEQSPSHVQISNQTATSVRLSWENGDGTGRLVLLKKLGKVNPFHIEDGIEYADGAGEFGAGTQTGEREYVVYVGEGSETSVTGLQSGRAYQVAVIEYNDSLSCPGLTNYLQETVVKKAFLTPGGSKFSAYPNPLTREILTVQLPENASGEAVLSLRDAYGRKIIQRQIKKLIQEDNEVSVDIAALNLPIGIYYLHMTGQSAIRLVKK